MLPRLRESAARAAYLRNEIETRPALEVALALDGMCGASEQADPVARDVLASLVTLLAEPTLGPRFTVLRRFAEEHALLPLGRLRRRRPLRGRRRPTTPPHPACRDRARRASSDPRGAPGARPPPSRAPLDKVLLDPHPMVIRNVLGNPRLTEDDVLRLVARRPAVAHAIAEVARHPRVVAARAPPHGDRPEPGHAAGDQRPDGAPPRAPGAEAPPPLARRPEGGPRRGAGDAGAAPPVPERGDVPTQ